MLIFRFSGRYRDIPVVRAREQVQYEGDLTKFLGLLLNPVLTPFVGRVSTVGINRFLLNYGVRQVVVYR